MKTSFHGKAVSVFAQRGVAEMALGTCEYGSSEIGQIDRIK
jgi:hypothetical protein